MMEILDYELQISMNATGVWISKIRFTGSTNRFMVSIYRIMEIYKSNYASPLKEYGDP